MALDHADQVQVLLHFLYVDGHFVEFCWVWSQIFIFDIKIEDVEEWETRAKCIVEILHSLVLSCWNLHVWIKELDDRGYPGENLCSKQIDIMHGKSFKDVSQH